jgi:hypothetical protein
MPSHVDPDPDDMATIDRTLRAALDPVATVLRLHLLTGEQRAHVAELEREAEVNGAAGGIMPFENRGVVEALAADMVFAALTGPMVGTPPRPWTLMLDEDDQVIGEWLPAERIDEVKAGGRCIFLSSDFVMYKDRRPRGNGRFVMPYMPLEVPRDARRLVGLCGAGCPSPPADTYIRSLLGDPGSEVATLVLGACWADPPTQGDDRDE